MSFSGGFPCGLASPSAPDDSSVISSMGQPGGAAPEPVLDNDAMSLEPAALLGTRECYGVMHEMDQVHSSEPTSSPSQTAGQFAAAAAGVLPIRPSPGRRPHGRAVAQPQRCDPTTVLCFRYSQSMLHGPGPHGPQGIGGVRGEGSGSADEGPWRGCQAQLRYFLPENWSPSYKFTVFEDSYVLSFASPTPGQPWAAPGLFHLARPLHGARRGEGSAATAEFELAWPMPLDVALLESIDAACDRVVPGAKRKPQAPPLSLHSGQILQKLQRLDL